MSWLSLASLGLSLFSGLRQSSQAKSAGQAGYNQGLYNSQQASYFGQLNSGAIMEAGHINAAMTMEIANLNADYIEKAGERNLKLYGIQSEEELRRHVLAEKMNAGQIRAAQSGTGIQVNTGTNLRYLNFQIDEGLNQRHFMMVKHYETKKSIKEDYMDRAYVTRKSGELQAGAIEANAAIGADMALAQAQYQSSQYMMQGQQALQAGNQASSNALWGTLGNLAMFGMSEQGGDLLGGIKSFFGGSNTSSVPSMLASPTTSAAPPTFLTAPGGAGAPLAYGTPVYSKSWASNFMGQL